MDKEQDKVYDEFKVEWILKVALQQDFFQKPQQNRIKKQKDLNNIYFYI